jgi:hypothetical protein
MNAFLTWFKTNWKSNTIATVSIVYSAQQFTSAVIAWENHQPANWRTAIVSLIVAGVGYAAIKIPVLIQYRLRLTHPPQLIPASKQRW